MTPLRPVGDAGACSLSPTTSADASEGPGLMAGTHHVFRNQPAAALLLVGLGKGTDHFNCLGAPVGGISSSNTAIQRFPSFLGSPEPWVPIINVESLGKDPHLPSHSLHPHPKSSRLRTTAIPSLPKGFIKTQKPKHTHREYKWR